MIYKSYIVENNIETIKEHLVLIYGENIGLIEDLRKQIKFRNKQNKVLNFDQDTILNKKEIVLNELRNLSLFEQEKIYFINQVNDKILDFIDDLDIKNNNQKIYFYSEILQKRSKLRSFFEKTKECAIVPCYLDNQVGIKKIIIEKLNGFSGLTPQNLNLIAENCNLNRTKLNNEIEKIKTFFKDKIIDHDKLETLLDLKINEDFSQLRDAAFSGDKTKTNKLLNETVIEPEKNIFYLNILNQRISKLKEIIKLPKNENIELKLEKLKPPIFWKDKPQFIIQSSKWTQNKLEQMQNKTFSYEVVIKSNSFINKNILMKKLIIDVCKLANS